MLSIRIDQDEMFLPDPVLDAMLDLGLDLRTLNGVRGCEALALTRRARIRAASGKHKTLLGVTKPRGQAREVLATIAEWCRRNGDSVIEVA